MSATQRNRRAIAGAESVTPAAQTMPPGGAARHRADSWSSSCARRVAASMRPSLSSSPGQL
jgi:hypothetical protein